MIFIELVLIWLMYLLGGIDGTIYTLNKERNTCDLIKLKVLLRLVAIVLPIIITNVNWE